MFMVSFIFTTACVVSASNLHYNQQEDVVYHQAHGVVLVADIFTPKKNLNGHAVVVVASGGWSSDRGKIRDLNRAGLFEELCERGFHVFAIRPGSVSRFSAQDMKSHVPGQCPYHVCHRQRVTSATVTEKRTPFSNALGGGLGTVRSSGPR